MDAIDSNLRNLLKLPTHPEKWLSHQGNRSVFAAVQRAIADQNNIGWDNFLQGFITTRWETAQQLYQEILGDCPSCPPRSWTEGLLTNLWDFSFNIWSYLNQKKHGVTSDEQALLRRARVEAFVTDRYRHRPHLDLKYKWLFKKSLADLLKQGNRALYVWLGSINNFASISSGPMQPSIFAHALYKRLSDAAQRAPAAPYEAPSAPQRPNSSKIRGAPKV